MLKLKLVADPSDRGGLKHTSKAVDKIYLLFNLSIHFSSIYALGFIILILLLIS